MAERERCEGGRLVEDWISSNGTTKGDLLRRVTEEAMRRGGPEITRTTFWKWLVGDADIHHTYALVIEDICGVSGRVWARPAAGSQEPS